MSDVIHYDAGNGIRVNAVFAERFKRERMSVNIMLPLRAETAAENALLVGVLSHASEKYPDLLSLNRRLADMYGAKFATNVFKIGEIQVLRISITSIKNRFVQSGEDISRQCLDFLLSLILDPVLEDGAFRQSDVEIEKRNLIDIIEGSINDKRQYANERMISEMCAGENFGVKETGEVSDVEQISGEMLYDAWRRMKETAFFEFFTVGEYSGEEMAKTVSEAFSHVRRTPGEFPGTDVIYVRDKETRFITEEMNVEQAKLAIGLRTGVTAASADYLPLVYANAVFGSGVSSKLFTVVREKLHLCYYCSSRLDVHKGLMLIQSGIDESNYQKALDAITEQLDAVKRGDFTEKDTSAALLSLQNAYRSVEDSPAELESWYLRGLVSGRETAPEETAEQLARYTAEDIVRAAAGIVPDTVYLLKGREAK